MSKLRIKESRTPKFRDLVIGQCFQLEADHSFYQKTAASGWRPMATDLATGVARYVQDHAAVLIVPFIAAYEVDNLMSKMTFVSHPCRPSAVRFGSLQEGEVFRLASGEKLMIKSGGFQGVYLHSGNAKQIDLNDEVVRRKVELVDKGDEQ